MIKIRRGSFETNSSSGDVYDYREKEEEFSVDVFQSMYIDFEYNKEYNKYDDFVEEYLKGLYDFSDVLNRYTLQEIIPFKIIKTEDERYDGAYTFSFFANIYVDCTVITTYLDFGRTIQKTTMNRDDLCPPKGQNWTDIDAKKQCLNEITKLITEDLLQNLDVYENYIEDIQFDENGYVNKEWVEEFVKNLNLHAVDIYGEELTDQEFWDRAQC